MLPVPKVDEHQQVRHRLSLRNSWEQPRAPALSAHPMHRTQQQRKEGILVMERGRCSAAVKQLTSIMAMEQLTTTKNESRGGGKRKSYRHEDAGQSTSKGN
ncbi:Hypothetical predicted protein [Podarcis lilfordi]|uniref:Uncharacterized protein n=1 Tax=Podarcis lilfordi TaxID=74358 RepID=A0AA35PCA7_9SAUR|nr:Hypothetical predicted protein [Podarcis lilfordi]